MRALLGYATTDMQRPRSGELVWIEHEGRRQRAVYMAHNDMFMLGDGTRIAAKKLAQWSNDPLEGAAKQEAL